MKRILLLLMVVCLSLGAKAEGKSLVITFSDGKNAAFLLSETPAVSMENDKLTVTTTSTTAVYDLIKIQSFTFATVSGINNVVVEEEMPKLKGDSYIVPGANAIIRIFSIDGKKVSVNPIYSGGFTILQLSSLPTGIYIISANGNSVKIVKK